MNYDYSRPDTDSTSLPHSLSFIPIDLTEARLIIQRRKSLQLTCSLVIEQDATEGAHLLLRQQEKFFRLSTASGKVKRFLYTKSLAKTIASLFANGQPDCEIVYQHCD